MGSNNFRGREKFAVVWEIISFIRAVGENPDSIDLTYFYQLFSRILYKEKTGKRKGENLGGGFFFPKQHLSNNGGLRVGGFNGSFLKWAKGEKNSRVWLTSGNGEHGYQIYIVDWRKMGGVKVSLIAKRFLSAVTAVDPWDFLLAHCVAICAPWWWLPPS